MACDGLHPPRERYKILFLMPITYHSHRAAILPIAEALAERGHEVEMVTSLPAPERPLPANLSYYQHGVPLPASRSLFHAGRDMMKLINDLAEVFNVMRENFFDDSTVLRFYEKRHQYDLFVCDEFARELAVPFFFGKPYITVSTAGHDLLGDAFQGNLQNPSILPYFNIDASPPFNFVDTVRNIASSVWVISYWGFYLQGGGVMIELDRRFPGLPVQELIMNASISFINDDPSISGLPLANLPSQVEIAGIHCQPGRALPKDLAAIVDGSEPVIYFSMGSVTKGSYIPEKYFEIITQVFGNLPYKVIWKYENERKGIPKNVYIRKWLPQQDVLAQPNVALFISHCGLFSSIEALYHATPVLGLPLFGDQPRNAARLARRGAGRVLHWDDLTPETFRANVLEMMTNTTYADAAARISRAFRDQPQSARERAVFWAEYAARHRGAPHLRAPQWQLSLPALLHLDMLFLLYVSGYLLYRLLRVIGTKMYSSCIQ